MFFSTPPLPYPEFAPSRPTFTYYAIVNPKTGGVLRRNKKKKKLFKIRISLVKRPRISATSNSFLFSRNTMKKCDKFLFAFSFSGAFVHPPPAPPLPYFSSSSRVFLMCVGGGGNGKTRKGKTKIELFYRAARLDRRNFQVSLFRRGFSFSFFRGLREGRGWRDFL